MSVVLARCAATCGSVITEGHDEWAHPRRGNRWAEVLVDRVDDERVGDRRVETSHTDDRPFVAELGEQSVGGTLQCRAADDG